jgi:DNA invertase Pin-like site-specific DNA recombinase
MFFGAFPPGRCHRLRRRGVLVEAGSVNAVISRCNRPAARHAPAGKAMFQMVGVFAEFERAHDSERVRAGLAPARDEGKTLGRPKMAPATEKAIRAALSKGDEGMHKIADRFGRPTLRDGSRGQIGKPCMLGS